MDNNNNSQRIKVLKMQKSRIASPPSFTLVHGLYRVSHKKGIDKILLFEAAQVFNSQFLNLFGFSISVSFV